MHLCIPLILEQNQIAKRLFSFGKSENASIFGGTDESVPYGFGCLKDQQTAVYRAVRYRATLSPSLTAQVRNALPAWWCSAQLIQINRLPVAIAPLTIYDFVPKSSPHPPPSGAPSPEGEGFGAVQTITPTNTHLSGYWCKKSAAGGFPAVRDFLNIL